MKRILLATLILIAGTIGIASAQLTPEHTGHYNDPAQTGQGLELRVFDNGQVFATAYFGSVPGWYPTQVWFTVQGSAADGIYPLIESRAVFGEEGDLDLVIVGEVKIDVRQATCNIGDECLVARVRIDGRGEPQFGPWPEAATATFYLRKML